MLDMGFIDDIKYIFFYMREDRQTCLFSATMPREVLRLAQEYMVDPKEIRLNKKELSIDTIDQSYLVVHEREKFKHLCNFIRNKNERQTIVFAATKQRTHRLASERGIQGKLQQLFWLQKQKRLLCSLYPVIPFQDHQLLPYLNDIPI